MPFETNDLQIPGKETEEIGDLKNNGEPTDDNSVKILRGIQIT